MNRLRTEKMNEDRLNAVEYGRARVDRQPIEGWLRWRRTSNTEIRETEPRLGNWTLFKADTDLDKDWSTVARTDSRAGTMCRKANGAGSRFGAGRMDVGRLGRCRPQQQGQAKPCRPSCPDLHRSPFDSYFGIRLPLGYNGYLARSNLEQVTIG